MPVFDKYVALGDSAAAFNVGKLLAQRRRSSRMWLASKLEFADLRDSGAVLIGAYTNRWTMELTRGLRFQFAVAGGRPAIADTVKGDKWILNGGTSDQGPTEDYMIITRLLRGRTGRFLVTGAGLTQYGTEATGRILTTSDALSPILAKLPAGWWSRNLQLVLHSEILVDSPARSDVVAVCSW